MIARGRCANAEIDLGKVNVKSIAAAVLRKNIAVLGRNSREEVSELTAELFNQITVINLCGGQLTEALREAANPTLIMQLQVLHGASVEATRIAERLADHWGRRKKTGAAGRAV